MTKYVPKLTAGQFNGFALRAKRYTDSIESRLVKEGRFDERIEFRGILKEITKIKDLKKEPQRVCVILDAIKKGVYNKTLNLYKLRGYVRDYGKKQLDGKEYQIIEALKALSGKHIDPYNLQLIKQFKENDKAYKKYLKNRRKGSRKSGTWTEWMRYEESKHLPTTLPKSPPRKRTLISYK